MWGTGLLAKAIPAPHTGHAISSAGGAGAISSTSMITRSSFIDIACYAEKLQRTHAYKRCFERSPEAHPWFSMAWVQFQVTMQRRAATTNPWRGAPRRQAARVADHHPNGPAQSAADCCLTDRCLANQSLLVCFRRVRLPPHQRKGGCFLVTGSSRGSPSVAGSPRSPHSTDARTICGVQARLNKRMDTCGTILL